jgi:DNA invertase Pin-like site-specific DNA recombinase
MLKYIIYCRKSTDEAEKQILSIESQISELTEFANRQKLHVVEIVTEAKTAKMPGRKIFAQVLKRIENGEVNGIVGWHPDRLARNSVDGGQIVYLLDTGKLQDLKFPTFWFENTPQGKFMLNIAFGQSKYYVDNLSENVSRGLRYKLRNGIWPGKAPHGYTNNPKTRNIDIDREKSKGVLKAFSLFAEGEKSFKAISRVLFEFGITTPSGKPIHITRVKKLLTNRFYIGILFYKGEYYDGKHESFINKELFQKVQQQVKRLEKPQVHKKNFPFIGLARCSECGAAITAEEHIKNYARTKRTVTYHYYRCTRKIQPCKQKPIPERELEEQLREKISDVALPLEWKTDWLSWLERDSFLATKNVVQEEEKLKKDFPKLTLNKPC